MTDQSVPLSLREDRVLTCGRLSLESGQRIIEGQGRSRGDQGVLSSRGESLKGRSDGVLGETSGLPLCPVQPGQVTEEEGQRERLEVTLWRLESGEDLTLAHTQCQTLKIILSQYWKNKPELDYFIGTMR